MESHLRPHQKVMSPNGIDDCFLVAGDDKPPSTSQHSPMAGLPLETLSTGQDDSNELLHLGSPNVPMTNSPVLFAQQCSAESTAINAIYGSRWSSISGTTTPDSSVPQPQQQFHLDEKPHALSATEGAAATPIRINGKYPCPFCSLEAKTFARQDSLKRHEKTCRHRIEDVIDVCLVRESDCQEHKSSTGHVDDAVANADTDQQEQVNEHPDASTNTGCGHAETDNRTTLGYEIILSIMLDRNIQQLTPLQSRNPQVQIRLNRIRDYYLQRDIEHAQEAESCDMGSHKAKQSDVKQRTGSITKSTISQAEDNDVQSKINATSMLQQ
ncbi:hypothetical protein HZS61_008682 [Fusarium oxysporum f. sp. conglutinans]|uniref:Uncharacterized protein n=1 Tax=Fusarium oxysporum f. sp. conglutinans TaxID=100902 RepID=A0A8H6LRS0_FUSOX|nr:hypothetical protein HZS61_008682 [Fusarium oxysporum f. sp. conglutinans]